VVYAADRAVLKEVMSKDFSPWPPSTEVTSAHHQETPPAIETIRASTSPNIAEEVMHDLQRLQVLRLNFESMFMEDALHASPRTSDMNSIKHTPDVDNSDTTPEANQIGELDPEINNQTEEQIAPEETKNDEIIIEE